MLNGIEGRNVLKEVLMEWTSYLARDERGRSGSICVRFERTSKNRVCRGLGYWYLRSIVLREVHHAIRVTIRQYEQVCRKEAWPATICEDMAYNLGSYHLEYIVQADGSFRKQNTLESLKVHVGPHFLKAKSSPSIVSKGS